MSKWMLAEETHLWDQTKRVPIGQALAGRALLDELDPSTGSMPAERMTRRPASGDFKWQRKQDATYESLVVFQFHGPEWLDRAMCDVAQLESLPNDWDGEGSPPPPPLLLATARSLLTSLRYEQIPNPFVAPLSGGGLQLEWQYEGRELEIVLWEPTTFEYLKVSSDESMEEGQYTARDFSALDGLIEWLRYGR